MPDHHTVERKPDHPERKRYLKKKPLREALEVFLNATTLTRRTEVVAVEEAIQTAGASLRYLPQYSPEFNPIELVFHPLKALLRKAAERTIKGLERYVRSFIRTLNPSQCMGYFRHAGYEPL